MNKVLFYCLKKIIIIIIIIITYQYVLSFEIKVCIKLQYVSENKVL